MKSEAQGIQNPQQKIERVTQERFNIELSPMLFKMLF